MTTCYMFMVTNLDGFMARSDGNIDWLRDAHSAGDLFPDRAATTMAGVQG